MHLALAQQQRCFSKHVGSSIIVYVYLFSRNKPCGTKGVYIEVYLTQLDSKYNRHKINIIGLKLTSPPLFRQHYSGSRDQNVIFKTSLTATQHIKRMTYTQSINDHVK